MAAAYAAMANAMHTAGIPGFASGGLATGVFTAGEAGPELIYSPAPVRVMSNSQSNAAVIDGGQVTQLLNDLITEIRAGNVSIASSNIKIAKIMQKFDLDGMPPPRTVA